MIIHLKEMALAGKSDAPAIFVAFSLSHKGEGHRFKLCFQSEELEESAYVLLQNDQPKRIEKIVRGLYSLSSGTVKVTFILKFKSGLSNYIKALFTSR